MNIVSTFPVPVIDLPYLADEINDAHRQVIFHGKSMLLEARRAGEHLLKAKEQVRHGEFKAWIERHCACSYSSAQEYMRVARLAEKTDLRFFDGGIRAFLEAHSTPRPKEDATPTFDRTDAEHVMKLHAMAERGGTESEREVAHRKLEAHAKSFGMAGEEAVAKAQDMLPDQEKTDKQVRMERAEAETQAAKAETEAARAEAASLRAQLNAILTRTKELETEVQQLSRDELVARYIGLVLEREGLTKLKKAA